MKVRYLSCALVLIQVTDITRTRYSMCVRGYHRNIKHLEILSNELINTRRWVWCADRVGRGDEALAQPGRRRVANRHRAAAAANQR